MIALVAAGVVMIACCCAIAYFTGVLHGVAKSDELVQPVLDSYKTQVDAQKKVIVTYEELCEVYRFRIDLLSETARGKR